MKESSPVLAHVRLIPTDIMPDKAIWMMGCAIDHFSAASSPFLLGIKALPAPYAGVIKFQEKRSSESSLRSVIQAQARTGNRFSEPTIWNIAYGALKALAFLHTPSSNVQKLNGQYCFVHGHITPDTVFLSPNQMPKIGNLHCCTLVSCGLPSSKTGGKFKPYLPVDIDSSIFPPLITPGYEPLIDIWGLGMLLLQACAVSKDDVRSEYSEDMADFIDKLLTEDDRLRPTATEALQNQKFTELDTMYIAQSFIDSSKTGADHKGAPSALTPSTASLSVFASAQNPLAIEDTSTLVSKDSCADQIASNLSLPSSFADFTNLHIGIILRNEKMVEANLSLAGKQTAAGMSALMLAAIYNLAEVVPLLRPIESGLLCKNSHTAYYYSLLAGNIAIADILYSEEYHAECAANPEAFLPRPNLTVIERMQHAIEAQNIVEVHYLTMTETGATRHYTPIMHRAVELNNWQIVLILVRFEAQKRDSDGETCLHKAVRLGHTKIVEILAPYEANIVCQDIEVPGRLIFAVDLAIANGYSSCFDILKLYEHRREYAAKGLLLKDTKKTTPLIAAVMSKDINIIRLRCQENQLVYDSDGYTALMRAVLTNQLEAVVLLRRSSMQLCRNQQHKGLSSLWLGYIHEFNAAVRVLAPYEGMCPNPCQVLPFDASLSDGKLSMVVELEDYSNYVAPTRETLEQKLSELPWHGAMELTLKTCTTCSPETLLFAVLKDQRASIKSYDSITSTMDTPNTIRSLSCSSTHSASISGSVLTSPLPNIQCQVVDRLRQPLLPKYSISRKSVNVDSIDKVHLNRSQTLSSVTVITATMDNIHHLNFENEGTNHDCMYEIKRMQILYNMPSYDSSIPVPGFDDCASHPAQSSLTNNSSAQPSTHWFDQSLFLPDTPLQEDSTCALEPGTSSPMSQSPSNLTLTSFAGHDLQVTQIDPKITNLMLAVLANDPPAVIHYRDELCMQTSNGTTALMLAVAMNNLTLVRLLIGEKGIRRYDGLCASNFARKDAAEIKAILAGEHKCFRDQNGRTPLMQHILQNILHSRTALSYILRAQDDSVVCVSRESMGPVTALGFAAFRGMERIIQNLIGVNDFYSISRSHRTPLMIAAIAGRLNTVKLLYHSFVGFQDRDGYTALAIAAHHGHADVVEFLLPYESHLCTKTGLNATMVAAKKNRVRCLEAIHKAYTHHSLKQQYSYMFNTRDCMGRPAIIHAANEGNLDAFTWLVDNTEESNILLARGTTILMYCCKKNMHSFVKVLAQRNKGVGLLDHCGRTALMIAAAHNHAACVQILSPFEMNIRGIHNTTALIFAAKNGAYEAAQLLLNEAKLKEDGGYTALYYAVGESYNSRLIDLLLPHEASIHPELLEAAVDQFCPINSEKIYARLQAELEAEIAN